MERRTCRVCSRTFSNGRALGGHMRSHMTILSPSPQTQKTQVAENESASSSSASSSSEEEEEEEDATKPPYYVLRENPQKSFRFADPEFSFAVDASSIVQDRESETESSKHPRRSSKRTRRSEPEPEPLSSVSDTTTEEDVALCLMMLSRDAWRREHESHETQDSDEQEEDEYYEKVKFTQKGRSRYKCETCKKVFRSYQALGGHRASHKKIRGCSTDVGRAHVGDSGRRNAADGGVGDGRRIHQCPVCYRVFSSGQALGGHKRSHFSASTAVAAAISMKFQENLIDLNLPAPFEDDNMSQVELSAVSDAEFVDPAK